MKKSIQKSKKIRFLLLTNLKILGIIISEIEVTNNTKSHGGKNNDTGKVK
nr:MAG TPA: hypothetical protein [Caudoviricetes sp.]